MNEPRETEPLHELLDSVEITTKALAMDGPEFVPSFVIGRTADGGDVSVPMNFGDEAGRNIYQNVVRATFRRCGVERYAIVTEAWTTAPEGRTAEIETKALSLGKHPKDAIPDENGAKRRVVIIVARDRSRSMLRAYRIDRDADGRVRRLALDHEERDDVSIGMDDLLPCDDPEKAREEENALRKMEDAGKMKRTAVRNPASADDATRH
jgi:hypothetical protein